jgi:hypothetical protein
MITSYPGFRVTISLTATSRLSVLDDFTIGNHCRTPIKRDAILNRRLKIAASISNRGCVNKAGWSKAGWSDAGTKHIACTGNTILR